MSNNILVSHFHTFFLIPRYGILQYLPFGIIRPRMILDLEELNSKEDYLLTQHANFNSECNKLIKSLKLILKHETNIKTTFKIMNAYAKLKVTLNMKFDHLGQGLLFSP